MASRQIHTGNGYIRTKQWRARVRENWREYYLGHYLTKEEAEQMEDRFRAGK